MQNVRLQGQEETEAQEVGEIESFSPENARPRAFSFPALGALTFSVVAANNKVERRRAARKAVEPRVNIQVRKALSYPPRIAHKSGRGHGDPARLFFRASLRGKPVRPPAAPLAPCGFLLTAPPACGVSTAFR